MLEKISIDDLNFFQVMVHPVACAQILFSDFDNLSSFSETDFGQIRNYQYFMLGYDTLLYEDKTKSKKENFDLKNGLSENYNLGGRLTGKTIISIIIDSLISTFHQTYNWAAICSLDALHLRGVFEKIIEVLENHPIFKMLGAHILRSPTYKINTKNGCLLESINSNIAGKNPGGQFFGKHVSKLWQEESSFMTKQVSNKQLMAQAELGCINRWSGMTTFAKASPMGEIFYNLKNETKIINFPSYTNPTWSKEKEDAAIQEFGGKSSAGFEVQILGKVIESSDTVYDIQRIRECYLRDRDGTPIPIKGFEINKNNFYRYKEIIVVDRPNNVERVWVCLDKGEGAVPTEVIVLFEINGIYKYEYNITTFKLSPTEDDEVVEFIIEQVKANIVGIDHTSGGGKAMLSHLAKKYPENIKAVDFNSKINIDFDKDEKGNIKYDSKGNPEYKAEYVVDWSIQRLKHLFYNKKISALYDNKLDQQFDGITVMKSGQRTVYGSKVANHLHQAFQVFSICQWNFEFAKLKPIQRRKMGIGA
jgi:hypothetical protein